MSTIKRNQSGRLSPRESLAYTVLCGFLIYAGSILLGGKVIIAFCIAASGFAVAVVIIGNPVDPPD